MSVVNPRGTSGRSEFSGEQRAGPPADNSPAVVIRQSSGTTAYRSSVITTGGFLLAAATASAIAAATPALADGGRAPFDGMTEQAISQIVTYAGYDVVDIDLKGRLYRVEAYEPAGEKVRLLVRVEDGSILAPPDAQQNALAVRD